MPMIQVKCNMRALRPVTQHQPKSPGSSITWPVELVPAPEAIVWANRYGKSADKFGWRCTRCGGTGHPVVR